MIYEYAIDPNLVKAWVLNRDVGLVPHFGLDHRRVLSDVADDWEGQLFSTLLSSFDWDYEAAEFIDARQFLEGLLVYLKQGTSRGLKRSGGPWLDDVLAAHGTEPFHAILADKPTPDCAAVITPDVTRSLGDTRWFLPTINVTSKTPEALAAQLAPLLRMAREIVLVDPYFQANKPGYPEVLSALLRTAVASRAVGRPWPSVVIMSGVEERTPAVATRSPADQMLSVSRNRCEYARRLLGLSIPKGMTITFQCIRDFAAGDQVHNRYLLTDVGGASIPYGVQASGDRVFDDITPLFDGQYKARWKQYGKGEGLNVVGDPVLVQGLLA